MQQQPAASDPLAEPAVERPVAHLELKARLLLLFTVLLVAGSTLYLLYARGLFEPTQTLVLTTDDSEGVVVGMDMTFSGFPIGRVRKVELAPQGNVEITIDVPTRDARWLRTSSVFTLVRSLVGGTAIRAFSGVLTDPPLPDGAVRQVLRGDATAELPRVIATAREVLENINAMTGQDGALRATLANAQAVTDKLKGPQGALGVLLGNEADTQRLLSAVDRTNRLLSRMDALAARADAMAARADTQLLGPEGLVRDAKATVAQLNAVLADTRGTLAKVDGVLAEAQAVGSNVRGATTDLGTLRNEVEANLRKIEGMVDQINRKWPFAKDTEIKLP